MPPRRIGTEQADKAVEARLAGQEKEKKPPLSQFAAQLGLSDVQRDGVQREVLRGQVQIMEALKVPAADGTVFLDQLVDVFVDMASGPPEQAQARMVGVFSRLMTERIPGREETYSVHIETIKKGVSETFRRDFTPEQWVAYEKMGQDPTEIQVEGGPWQELMAKVGERVAAKQAAK